MRTDSRCYVLSIVGKQCLHHLVSRVFVQLLCRRVFQKLHDILLRGQNRFVKDLVSIFCPIALVLLLHVLEQLWLLVHGDVLRIVAHHGSQEALIYFGIVILEVTVKAVFELGFCRLYLLLIASFQCCL